MDEDSFKWTISKTANRNRIVKLSTTTVRATVSATEFNTIFGHGAGTKREQDANKMLYEAHILTDVVRDNSKFKVSYCLNTGILIIQFNYAYCRIEHDKRTGTLQYVQI